MRTQTRIAVIFFLVTLVIIITLSGAVYFFVAKYAFTDFYKRLETRALLASRIRFENESSSVTAFQEMRDSILEKLPKEEDRFFEITPARNFEAESRELDLPVSFFADIVTGKAAQHQKGDIFFSGIRYERNGTPYAVIVSAENYYYSHHLSNFRKVLLGTVIFVTFLALTVSIIFSRYVFDPVRQITNQVKDINSQNLHLRLKASGANDDVNELKATFNTMLDRLETAFATQNNFISNASHELGTPITAIMGEAEVALSKIRAAEEYRETLRVILSEAERLDRITKSLLLLAQTGFDGVREKSENVRIDQLLWDVKAIIEKMNPKNKVHINLSLLPENPNLLKIRGNEQLLHLALTNIVSNGCKYSNHQPVALSIGISDNHIIIVIKDNGIGIPQDEIKYIYDPFFRASNTQDFEGYGIGLPLTRNIVRMHKGTLRVESTLNQGTVVQMAFPISTYVT
jgi:signal transduction histidine kinase